MTLREFYENSGMFNPDLLLCLLHESAMIENKIQKYEENQHQLIDIPLKIKTAMEWLKTGGLIEEAAAD